MTSSNYDSIPLIPSTVDVTRLPKPLREGDKSLTVAEARETYLRLERAAWKTDGQTSKHMSHKKGLFPRILESDRRFQERYNGLTTAKLTRGISPFTETGERLTPWELDEMLNGGTIRRRVRTCLNYHLFEKRGFDFEWVAVTSTTQTTGSPREYVYIWIEDPEDDVSPAYLAPALEKHIDGCENARKEAHPFRESGMGGAITVEHTPPLVEYVPKKFFEIRKVSKAEALPNTRGAAFVAKQLVHLPVGDYYNSQQKAPANTLLDGAVLSWISPYRWFRASGGVPNLS